MKRRLTIQEENGLYTIQHDGWTSSGGTLENALVKAVQTIGQEGVPLEVTFKAAELLDTLLGRPRENGGQIHTGVLPA